MSNPYVQREEVTDVRLLHLAGNAFSGHRIGTWCISAKTGQIFFTTALHEAEVKTLFQTGGCREYAFSFEPDFDKPFLMSDQNGLVWLGEYATLDCAARMLIVMGPVFYASTSVQHIVTVVDDLCNTGIISLGEKTAYEGYLREVPVVSSQTMAAYARMLHFTITGKTLPPSEIHYQTVTAPQHPGAPEPGVERSWVDYSHVHEQEQLFLQCVREGNLNYRSVMDGLNFSVMDFALSENPMRSERYKFIVNAALSTRAAIEGGLSPKIALDIENRYIAKADKLSRVTAMRELNLQFLDELIRRVHESKARSGLSRHIQECCEYVSAHLTDDLSVQTLAGQIGYTEYYLTRKFQKEMGVRLVDYIKEARLEYAKVCLLSTAMSIEEISDMLQFNSRNQFTRVFRDKTGITPTEFRTRKPTEL